MRHTASAPLRVRCNRGFGWTFWLIICVTAVVTLLVMASEHPVPGLGLGAFVATVFVLLRALALPRLEILVSEGALHTRRRTVPFSAIARVQITNESRAGVWATFTADDNTTLARMALADTLFAVPTADQWEALAAAIRGAAVARGVAPQSRPATGSWVCPAEALDVLERQVAWCRAGHRSSSRQAPATALRSHGIALQPGQL